jgi:glycine oxidase
MTRPYPAEEPLPDVAIVGGGVIGLSVAWQAAVAGLTVAIADPDPGRGASWVAAGMLAPVAEVHYGEEALLRLTLASHAAWPGFADALSEATGEDPGYRTCGTLLVAVDADENAALDDVLAFQQRLGLPVERLTSREVRRLEPGLATSTRGGILVPDDHQVDNRALVDALLTACTRAGVRLHRQAVRAVETVGDRACGMRLADGTTVTADQVVLAAGCWSGGLDGLPPAARLPVRPVKGQLLHLRGALQPEGTPPLATRTIRGARAYVVSRPDGRVVVGATAEERGFDTTVTAGGVHDLLRASYELLPGIAELELVEATAGLRPGTPDNAPLLGPTALPGLVAATGHYRNGVLLAPATASALADLLATGQVPDAIRPFTPQRFARATTAPDGRGDA